MFTIQKHKVCGKSSYLPKILIFNLTLKEKTVKLRMSSFSEFPKKYRLRLEFPYLLMNNILWKMFCYLSCIGGEFICIFISLFHSNSFFLFNDTKLFRFRILHNLICCCYTSRYLNIGNIRGWFSRNLTSSELIALFFGMLNDSGSDHGLSIPHLSLAFTLIK